MKYLCLVYGEEKTLDAMSKGDMDVLVNDSLAYDDTLRKSGHYIVSQALHSVQHATTLRDRNGKLSIIDGPFAENQGTALRICPD